MFQLKPLRNDSRILIAAALIGLRHIYGTGVQYKKAGIMLMGLQSTSIRHTTMFDTVDPANTLQFISALNGINQRFCRGMLRLASEGIKPRG